MYQIQSQFCELLLCHMNYRQEETIQRAFASRTSLQAPPQGKGGKHHCKNMQTKGSELPPQGQRTAERPLNQSGLLEACTRSTGP